MGFISLYLQIDGTENLPRAWVVNASFKFFLLDQIRDKYLIIEEGDGVIKRFYPIKTEWGIAQALSLDHFNDASKGYLVDDCCTFGVEIFVHKRTGRLERLSMIKHPPDNKITFTLQNYSQSYSDFYTSNVRAIGDSKWKLHVYPRGVGEWKNLSLSVFLELVDAFKLLPKGKLYAKYKFRVKDVYNSSKNRESAEVSHWFTAESLPRGFRNFVPLWELRDPSNNYIIYDTLTVEAEIITVSKVKL